LDNISYTSNNQTYTNPNVGWFSILESNDGENWVWNAGIGDQVSDGQWFGIVVMDPVTWVAEINVPLVEPGIAFEEVGFETWYGNGENEVMFVVDFDSDPIGTDSAFAWGIRFEADSLSGQEILDLIAQSNSDFTFDAGGGFLNNINYTTNGQTFTNPNAGWFSSLEAMDGVSWAWNNGLSDNVGNGQWFGIVAMDPNTFEAVINVPLLFTDVKNHYVLDVKVYPNPASEKLHIHGAQEASVHLMNLSGQTVYSSSGKIESIDVTNLQPGLYVLTIYSGDQTTNNEEKIISELERIYSDVKRERQNAIITLELSPLPYL
jgi:hypothetical protein